MKYFIYHFTSDRDLFKDCLKVKKDLNYRFFWTHTKSISNAFNNYFSNIGKELDNQIPRGHSNIMEYLHSPVKDSFFLFLPQVQKLNFKYQKLASVVSVYKNG